MKHKYTDEEIQTAIDAACEESSLRWFAATKASPHWIGDAESRRDLLKSALTRLPEPPPPGVDGKTPGDIAYDAFINGSDSWEASASAVLAAFGGAGLEAAIARMEAVTNEELNKAHWDGQGAVNSFEANNRIRALLISAAREGQSLPIATLAQDQVQATPEMLAAADAVLREEMSQTAEIPWTPWGGGECPIDGTKIERWDFQYRDGGIVTNCLNPSKFVWSHNGSIGDIIAYRVTKYREGFGPAAVDWKAKYEECEKNLRAKFEPEVAEWKASAERWKEATQSIREQINAQQARAEKAEAELADAKPYLQEPDLPDEAVDIQANRLRAKCEWLQGICSGYEKQIQQANETLRDSLPHLRPIVEAGPVPAGAVRVYAWTNAERLCLSGFQGSTDTHFANTHFADILLPEAKAPAVEAAKTADTFDSRGKPWTPTFGDVVMLKRGGPKMTVIDIEETGELWCQWFQEDGTCLGTDFPAATLQLAYPMKIYPYTTDDGIIGLIRKDEHDAVVAELQRELNAAIEREKAMDRLHQARMAETSGDMEDLREELNAAKAALSVRTVSCSVCNETAKLCDWKEDEDGNWDTQCGQCMCFDYAPPKEQGYKFCHHCGHPINFINYTESLV